MKLIMTKNGSFSPRNLIGVERIAQASAANSPLPWGEGGAKRRVRAFGLSIGNIPAPNPLPMGEGLKPGRAAHGVS
jgi:hypothetical protein